MGLLRVGLWISVSGILSVVATAGCSDEGPGAGSNAGNAGNAGSAGSGGGTTTTPATVVKRSPAEGQPLWYRDQIQLEFSEPLDVATVTAANIAITAAGKPVAASLTASADGKTVTLKPTNTPPLPTTLEVAIAGTLKDAQGEGAAEATVNVDMPLWDRPAQSPVATGTAPAVTLVSGNPVVAYTTLVGKIAVSSYGGTPAAWRQLGSDLGTDLGSAHPDHPALTATADGSVVVAYSDPGELRVEKFTGSEWEAVGTGLGPIVLPARFIAGDTLSLAYAPTTATVRVIEWTGSAWSDVAPVFDSGGSVNTFDVVRSGAAVTLAYVDEDNSVVVLRSSAGGAWQPLGPAITRAQNMEFSVSLAVGEDDAPIISYIDGDDVNRTVQIRRFDSASGTWATVAPAPNLTLDAPASEPQLARLDDGGVTVSWLETRAGKQQLLVARWHDDAWSFFGPALNISKTHAASEPALALDERGNPNLVWAENGNIEFRRYNDSPEPPLGITTAVSTTCAIPEDGAANFPATLTATGCFSDVAKRVPAPGVIPYDINSPLWSDGALKQRFLVIPQGQTIGYADDGSWAFPVGTILIKEFALERTPGDQTTLFPMETRFLVKRCEASSASCETSWQGYSYQWNAAGTEADLRSPGNTEIKQNFAIDGGSHSHILPARSQCNTCHTKSAGFALGLRTGQMNRSIDYGTTIDNQLRALAGAGLFGSTYPKKQPGALARMPSPNDISQPLGGRARAYFDANCSHCHNPEGVRATIDFRYSAPLSATNICNQLDLANPSASLLYVLDATRGATQMPKIATDVPDHRQLKVTLSWIDSLTSCP